MVSCPNCKKQLLEGSFFCPECGAQLVPVDRLATQSIRRESTDRLHTSPIHPYPEQGADQDLAIGSDLAITLNLVDTGQVIHLQGQSQYLLGRAAEGLIPCPDIDLTPYEAFSQGVSRQHALLKITGPRVYIMDLGSSNGTRINGQKINPRVEFPVNHGDVIALGKLKIQFLVHK